MHLGRRAPTDWAHYEAYPLAALTTVPTRVPVVIGVNWYTDFDSPVKKDHHWWIGLDHRDLGSVRGGHCVCLQPKGVLDPSSWWTFYNQGAEGACVGFGSSRAMSLLNRRRYLARWLWDEARLTDEYGDNDDLRDGDQGTSVRAAMAILQARGHVVFHPRTMDMDEPYKVRDARTPTKRSGIAAYRWASTADEVLSVLDRSNQGWVAVLNSWGREYPHVVRMPAETLQRLIDEAGEAAFITDR